MSNESQILIVGAGPSGLTAAIELRRFGLPVRLVDKSSHPAQWSQALIVQARTLEQFERYGIAAEAVSRGRIVTAGRFHEGPKSLALVDLEHHIPGRFPFALCLPQNDTEDILIRHLRTLGVEVERETELTSFSNTAAGDAVLAHLQHAEGRKEQVHVRYLLGCDGAHSRVRQDTLATFAGDTVAERFALGDLHISGPDLPPSNEISLYFHEGGWVMLILHLPNGQHRVITVYPGEKDAETPAAPTVESFNADFQRFGLQLTASDATWLSPFRVNERKANQYRHGRAFLLGDAAHIHSPVGGQGMNTGIQDAANLAWKLAAVESGAPATLLDSYDAERGAVARAVLRGSGIGLRLAGSQNTVVEHVRNFVMRHALGFEFVDDLLARNISQTAIQYRDSPIVVDNATSGPLHAGDRMPDAELPGGSTLLAPLQQAHHLLLAHAVPSAAIPRDLKHIVISELPTGDNRWSPPLESLLGPGPLLYLIRPDGYIGFRGTADSDKFRAYAAGVGLL